VARSRGISGVAVGMIATGVLLVRAAIRGTSPMDELRQLITGQRPEPLSTQSRGTPLKDPAYTPTPAGTGTGSGKSHATGKEAPHVAAEMSYIANTWGIQVYGWRARGSVPGSDHPKGLAIDAMVGKDRAKGDAIAAYYVQNAKMKNVKYVIWWGRIWTASSGRWRGYFGPSPHKDHPHISFYQIVAGRVGR
jgi:hypothetical protein